MLVFWNKYIYYTVFQWCWLLRPCATDESSASTNANTSTAKFVLFCMKTANPNKHHSHEFWPTIWLPNVIHVQFRRVSCSKLYFLGVLIGNFINLPIRNGYCWWWLKNSNFSCTKCLIHIRKQVDIYLHISIAPKAIISGDDGKSKSQKPGGVGGAGGRAEQWRHDRWTHSLCRSL